MKKLILMLAIAGFITGAFAQNLMFSEVPAAVAKAFKKTHSKIDTFQWSKVSDSYKVNYNVKMKEMAVIYSASGKLISTEKEITFSELPTSILEYVNDNLQGGPIKKTVVMTTSAGKSTYVVRVKEKDLTFDSKGKFII